ncbi:winged helix-turn-helix transcriptional regulator [Roseovarius sp.]|uniref:winged helix-turn-helix transcriptional regulator n=1 Tax=Roseovarius sp. TaxID=1486281 RepID=UPI003BAD6125
MKGYGQFCPIAKAAELFCEKWTALVIRNISAGAHRFSDIHRGVPLMSATLLSKRLKHLEAEGIVTRRRAERGKHWRYELTEAGAEFVPLVGQLAVWGRRWSRRELDEGELDLGLLIWGLEYTVDPAAFGAGRTVVELCFTDQPRHKSRAWFVNEGAECTLCMTDPGFEIDLYLAATLANMIHVYRGDIGLAAAIGSDRLEVIGDRRLAARLKDWLNLGPLAEMPPARPAPAQDTKSGSLQPIASVAEPIGATTSKVTE